MESVRCKGTRATLRASWQRVQDLFSASSPAEAWQAFKLLVDALPGWAFVVIILVAALFAMERTIVLIPLAIVGALAALYFTVKFALRAALRERDLLR